MQYSDELTYGQVVEIATLEAGRRGLSMKFNEKDETLFAEVRRTQSSNIDPSRQKVNFWTHGTGAFIVDFDDQWTWSVTEYTRKDQEDAVRQIIEVIGGYFLGAGDRQRRKKGWRGSQEVLVINLDSDDIVLQTKS